MHKTKGSPSIMQGPSRRARAGNRLLLIATDDFAKWPKVYATPNQEASTVADALVTNFFCRFGVPRELHTNQCRNFESRLRQQVLERQRTSNPQLDGMVERYVKTVEDHLRNVVSAHQSDWNERLPIFLHFHRASPHETTSTTSISMVFGRELRLPCDLLFGAAPDKEKSASGNVVDFVHWQHDIHQSPVRPVTG
jgi:hypothetical protein